MLTCCRPNPAAPAASRTVDSVLRNRTEVNGILGSSEPLMTVRVPANYSMTVNRVALSVSGQYMYIGKRNPEAPQTGSSAVGQACVGSAALQKARSNFAPVALCTHPLAALPHGAQPACGHCMSCTVWGKHACPRPLMLMAPFPLPAGSSDTSPIPTLAVVQNGTGTMRMRYYYTQGDVSLSRQVGVIVKANTRDPYSKTFVFYGMDFEPGGWLP